MLPKEPDLFSPFDPESPPLLFPLVSLAFAFLKNPCQFSGRSARPGASQQEAAAGQHCFLGHPVRAVSASLVVFNDLSAQWGLGHTSKVSEVVASLRCPSLPGVLLDTALETALFSALCQLRFL